MVEFAVISIFLGVLGSVGGFVLAWSFRENSKWVKGGVIAGIICIVLLIVGIFLLASWTSSNLSPGSYGSSSSSEGHKCAICGKSYSSGGTSNMCSQCYKNYKYAANAAGY